MRTETQGRVNMHVLGKVTDLHYMGTMAQAEIEITHCSTHAFKSSTRFRFAYEPKQAPLFQEGDTIGIRLDGSRWFGYQVLGIMRGV